MAIKDWKQTGINEFTNKKKKLVLLLDTVYDKTVVSVLKIPSFHTEHQKIFIKFENALKYAERYMRKH